MYNFFWRVYIFFYPKCYNEWLYFLRFVKSNLVTKQAEKGLGTEI